MSHDHPMPTDRLDAALEALRAMPAPGRPADADVLALITPRRRNWMRTLIPWSAAAGVLVAAATVYFLTAAPAVALADVVKAMNAIGASPADLVAILEALKEAGALKADLVIL